MLSPAHRQWAGCTAAAAIGLVLAACGPDASSPTDVVAFDHTIGEPAELHKFQVCKVGTDASFEVTITPQSTGVPDAPFQVDVADGECAVVADFPFSKANVSVTEIADPAIVLDSIIRQRFFIPSHGPEAPTKLTGTSTVAGSINGDIGIVATFYNRPRPPGTEGCTPGYWKQEHHFDSWTAPHTPASPVDGTFAVPANYLDKSGAWLGGFTLVEGLSFKGGSHLGGAAGILLRAGIAALLNAASADVDYPLTTSEVLDAVNDALASQDRDTMLGVASDLDEMNNLGCPLN